MELMIVRHGKTDWTLTGRYTGTTGIGPYERLLADAMAGDGALFTREDAVEAAWEVVDPVLGSRDQAKPCDKASWGPAQADTLIAPYGRWHNPALGFVPPATRSEAWTCWSTASIPSSRRRGWRCRSKCGIRYCGPS